MLVRFFYRRLFGLAVMWFRISQWTSKFIFGTRPLPKFADHKAISAHLRWGSEYKRDPLKGMLDSIVHPGVVEKRLRQDKRLGDCDDHAVYRLSAMIRSRLCSSAWLGCVWYETHEGTTEGHAVAIWRDPNGDLWWADYGHPKPAGVEPWEWPAKVLLAGYGKRPLCAARIRITGVTPDGALVFGGHVSTIFPDDHPTIIPPPMW